MKRREFFNRVGLGLLAASFPVAIAACSPDSTEATDEAANAADTDAPVTADAVDSSVRDDGFAALGTVATLDSEGFLADKNFAAGPVIVVRDPADLDSVVALNSTCNHQGCNVDWKETEFVCPCHGSKFGADGGLVNGPATAPLVPYEAMIEGDVVLVKAA